MRLMLGRVLIANAALLQAMLAARVPAYQVARLRILHWSREWLTGISNSLANPASFGSRGLVCYNSARKANKHERTRYEQALRN